MTAPHRTSVGTLTEVRATAPATVRAPERVLPSLVLAAIVLTLLGAAVALVAIPPGGADRGVVGRLPSAASAVAAIDAEAPPPRRVVVERLGIDAALINLRVQRDGSLEVPEAFDVAGWHRSGTAPGDVGPAVLVGHVDSYEGPAVFFRLRELQPGDRVAVTRADGSQVAFEVYGSETVAKDAFPTDRVYGPTDKPELRLLTCGGEFDRDANSYNDNVVVYARQV